MATGFIGTSPIVHDLIQKSKLISKGPPDRYHLLTTKSNLEENGLVRKWTFGQRDVNMMNKILLMVGETGTGKTLLINAMVNYILGVEFKDQVWFEITEEAGDHHMPDQSKSQTTEITVYEVFTPNNPISLSVIDTPGYGDTRGTEYDRKIAENLYKLFYNNTGVKEIDAVCLVVKASENRLSDRQQYIFDALLSLFGKDIEENILFFFTHSNGIPPCDALNAIKKAAIPCRKHRDEPVHFLFDNLQNITRSEAFDEKLSSAWKNTEGSLNDFLTSLTAENRKELAMTESVLSKTKRLKACVSNLQDRVQFVECKHKELTDIQKALQENQEKIKKNENFTFTVTKSYKQFVPISDASWLNNKVTSCSVCEENCHEYGCWFALNPLFCEVMVKDHCTVCTGKCHFKKHVKESMKYEIRSEKLKMTFKELKQQYGDGKGAEKETEFDRGVFNHVEEKHEHNKRQKEEMTSVEKGLQTDLNKNQEEKAELVDEACNTIMKLSDIALKTDSALFVHSLDFLIPRVKEIGKHNYVQKLEELRKLQPESEERVKTAMAYARTGFNNP